MKKAVKRLREYVAMIEPAEDGGYTVTVPSLPGCISQGDTYEEALDNIKEAIELYLEDEAYHTNTTYLTTELFPTTAKFVLNDK